MCGDEKNMHGFGIIEILFVVLVVTGLLAILVNKPGQKVRGDHVLDRLYADKPTPRRLSGPDQRHNAGHS